MEEHHDERVQITEDDDHVVPIAPMTAHFECFESVSHGR
jgi:hypothetical protein